MEKFEGYDGIVPDQRWKNELLWHLRRQTELLEKLIDLADLKKDGDKNVSVSTKRVSKRSAGEGQQRQRRSNSTRKRSE